MLLFLYTAQLPNYRKMKLYVSLACQVAIIADKYGLSTLRDHGIKDLIDMSKRTLPEQFQSNIFATAYIDLVRMVWETELDCFAKAKTIMLEELASAVDHISEHPAFQQLLADKKDLSLDLIRVLSKRAKSFTQTIRQKSTYSTVR